MIVTTIPMAFAADIVDSGTCGANGDNLTWTLDSDGVLTISGEGEMNNYNKYAPWDDYLDRIKTVVIEDGVTTIGDYAFYDCTELSEITIPDSVTTIGDTAFLGCTNLTTVNVPCIWDGTLYSFDDTVTLNPIVHKFTEYNQTEAPECDAVGKEVAICDHDCGATDEREIPALEHIDEDSDYLCDHGCGHEFEKPAEDTCDRCGLVHTNIFQKLICLLMYLMNRVLDMLTGIFI